MEEKERELLHFTEELQSKRLMSDEERAHLINEIAFREAQVAEMRSQVDFKTNKTKHLQRQVDEHNHSRIYENGNDPHRYDSNELQEYNGSDDLADVPLGKQQQQEFNVLFGIRL